MVEFETLQSEEIKLGKGLLIVAAKKAIGENGETEFIAITKADGSGRFKQTVTIPMDKEVVSELVRALQTVV
ncbi:MAG: hypothetical protein ACRD38_07850 [Nitrososphaerales archaeon]